MVDTSMTRDETFQQFGPLLTEAISLVLLDYINELRVEQGHPILTQQDLLNLINNHHSHLGKYDWMKFGP